MICSDTYFEIEYYNQRSDYKTSQPSHETVVD